MAGYNKHIGEYHGYIGGMFRTPQDYPDGSWGML